MFAAAGGLQLLDLSYNQFSGEFCPVVCRVPNSNCGFGMVLVGSGSAHSCDDLPLPGHVPSSLCRVNGTSALSDLYISSNAFSGILNVSDCLNLVLIEASYNQFIGFVNPVNYNRLHTVHLSNNSFGNAEFSDMLLAISAGRRVTDLAISWNK